MVFRKKKWEVIIGQGALVHVHYETASTEVINDGFKGLARELREVADQIEAANMTILTIPPLLRRLLGKGCGIGVHPLAHVRGGLRQLGRTATTALERLE
jgi:hypothetical protein